MYILPIVFLCMSIIYYLRKRHAMVLFSLTLLLTGCFGILSEAEYVVPKTDMMLLPTLGIFVCESVFFKKKRVNRLIRDNIGKIICVILAFLTFEYLRTVLFDIDSPIWAFKVVRVQLLLLIYFYLQRLDIRTWERYIRLVLIFSVIQGILYYLQLVGVTGILAKDIDEMAVNVRYTNYPLFAPFLFVYYILKPRVLPITRVLMLIFWGGNFTLTAQRCRVRCDM